jgi:Ser/Thr protein kinase RdoA (MazF antagonist)
MRFFERVDEPTQQDHLRALAIRALERYDVVVARCSLVPQSYDTYNTLFRVDTVGGPTFALRLSPEGTIHAQGSEIAEAEWLVALRRDTDLPVPELRTTTDGSLMVELGAAEVPGQRRCALFGWLPGEPMSQHPSADLAAKAGRISALLHQHGAIHSPPSPTTVLVADRVIYWRMESLLDELAPSYGSLFTDATERAQQVLDRLWRDPPHPAQIVHGDLTLYNFMVFKGRLTPIDFQDMIWGFELQDLAITIASIRNFDDANALVDAFYSGYVQVRPLPDHDTETLEGLIAARQLDSLNYALYVRKPELDTVIPHMARLMTEWLDRA